MRWVKKDYGKEEGDKKGVEKWLVCIYIQKFYLELFRQEVKIIRLKTKKI